MQPAHHAAHNFQILSCGLHKIKAFSIKRAVKPPFYEQVSVDFLAKNRDFDKFSSNRLKRDFFMKYAFLGCGFLT